MTTEATAAGWSLDEEILARMRDPATLAGLTTIATVQATGVSPLLLAGCDEGRILDIMRGESTPRAPPILGGFKAVVKLAEIYFRKSRKQREWIPDEEFAELQRFIDWQRDWYREHIAAPGIPRANGWPVLPTEYLFEALVAAGEDMKLQGRSTITDRRPRKRTERGGGGSRLPGMLRIMDETLPLPNDAWALDIRPGWKHGERVKAKRITIARARFDEWGFTATVRFNATKIRPVMVEALFRTAGSQIGIGSFREDPRKGHGDAVFGRFRVDSFTIGAAA